MRLKLNIRRHGLPPINLLFNVPQDSTRSLHTISNLLELVNETIPLEAETWGLEDYVVELDGFECLHYSSITSTLKDDDRVTIRPLETPEIRARHVAGRDQISSAGIHLLDGIPFGKTNLKRPSRPAIAIPPRKRARIDAPTGPGGTTADQNDMQLMQQAFVAMGRRLPENEEDRAVIQRMLRDQESPADHLRVRRIMNGTANGGTSSDISFGPPKVTTQTRGGSSTNANRGPTGDHTKKKVTFSANGLQRALAPLMDQEEAAKLTDYMNRQPIDGGEEDEDDSDDEDEDEDFDPEGSESEDSGPDNGNDAAQEAEETTKALTRYEALDKRFNISQFRLSSVDADVNDDNAANGSEDEDEEEDEDFALGERSHSEPDEEFWDANQSETASGVESASESSVGSKATGDHLRRSSTAKDKLRAGADNKSTTSSATSEASSILSSDSVSDSSSGFDSSSSDSEEEEQPKVQKIRRSPLTRQPFDPKRLQSAITNTQTPPYHGISKTQTRNSRRMKSNRLAKLKQLGVLPAGATKADMDRHLLNGVSSELPKFEQSKPGFSGRKATAGLSPEEQLQRQALLDSLASGGVDVTPKNNGMLTSDSRTSSELPSADTPDVRNKRTQLDVNASRRLISGSLGFRAPKTQADVEAIRAKLAKKPTAATEETHDSAEPEREPLTGDAWKSKINLTAFECVDEGIELSTPPFPFYQRWDPQQQYHNDNRKYGARGKKRKRNNKEYYNDGLKVYGEEMGIDEEDYAYTHDDANVQLDYDDPVEPTKIVDDLPNLPADPSTLPDAAIQDLKEDDIVVFKQLDCSEATKWAPQISDWRTATITFVTARGILNLKLAKRDRIHREIQYDEDGNRIYGKFEMQYDEEDEEMEDDGFRNVEFSDLIQPKILQIAPAATTSSSKLSAAVPTTTSGSTSERTWNGIEGDTDELAGIGQTQQDVSAQIMAESTKEPISISSDSEDPDANLDELEDLDDEPVIKPVTVITKRIVESSEQGDASDDEEIIAEETNSAINASETRPEDSTTLLEAAA